MSQWRHNAGLQSGGTFVPYTGTAQRVVVTKPTIPTLTAHYTVGGGYTLSVSLGGKYTYATFGRLYGSPRRHTVVGYLSSIRIGGAVYILCCRKAIYRVYRITPDMSVERIMRLYELRRTADVTDYARCYAFPPADGVQVYLADTLDTIYCKSYRSTNEHRVYHWCPPLGHRIDIKELALMIGNTDGVTITHCILDTLFMTKLDITVALKDQTYIPHSDLAVKYAALTRVFIDPDSAQISDGKIKWTTKVLDGAEVVHGVKGPEMTVGATPTSVIQIIRDRNSLLSILPRDIIDIVCEYIGQVEVRVRDRTWTTPPDMLKNNLWAVKNNTVTHSYDA